MANNLREEVSPISQSTTPQQHCEVLMNLSKDVEGQDDREDHFHLLACKTKDNSPDKAIFQLVKRGEGKDKFKEVKSFNAEMDTSVKVTITYSGEENPKTETMNSIQWVKWDTINNEDLKENCTVNWQESTRVHKLSCGSAEKTWVLSIWNE